MIVKTLNNFIKKRMFLNCNTSKNLLCHNSPDHFNQRGTIKKSIKKFLPFHYQKEMKPYFEKIDYKEPKEFKTLLSCEMKSKIL